MRNELCGAGINTENLLTLLPLMPPPYLLLIYWQKVSINLLVAKKKNKKKHASQIYNQQHQIELMLSINDYSTHTAATAAATTAAAAAVIVDDVIGQLWQGSVQQHWWSHQYCLWKKKITKNATCISCIME